jgi:hypothetical protein
MKAYRPSVLDALVECLSAVYWYKQDLRSFLVRAGVPRDQVDGLPWATTYKRAVARTLIDQLASDPIRGTAALDRLIDAVVEIPDSLEHLARLDDGRRKVEDARSALRRLRTLLGTETAAERADKARCERRTEAQRAVQQRQERVRDLESLDREFRRLSVLPGDAQSRQRRGYELQDLLRSLFRIHDLDPRGSFAQAGEQTDGSVCLDGTIVLVESRWTDAQTTPRDVRDFQGKVQSKLENTLGLMISMNGFTEEAINEAARAGRMVVVLMDGVDVAQVFAGMVDLTELLRRKIRHAAEQGRALYRVGE